MKKILLALILMAATFSCQDENPSLKDGDNQFQDFNYINENLLSSTGTPPTIGRFSPSYGFPGTEVIITGSGFGTTLSDIQVGFTESIFPHFTNWIEATVLEVTPDRLRVIVPHGAITGKVKVLLRVEEFIGVSYLSATSSTDFDILKDFPRNGLVAYYPFTGNGDEKGLNNTLLNFNLSDPVAPTLSSDRFGKANRSIHFDAPQYADILRQVIPENPWTISFWISPGALTVQEHHVISSYANSLGIDIILNRRPDGNYSFRVIGSSPSGPYTLTPNPNPTTGYISSAGVENNWINITLTYDGATFKLYKDNVEHITNTISISTPAGIRFILGTYMSSNNYMGKMDDVIVYDRALSPYEVMKVFEQTMSKY